MYAEEGARNKKVSSGGLVVNPSIYIIRTPSTSMCSDAAIVSVDWELED